MQNRCHSEPRSGEESREQNHRRNRTGSFTRTLPHMPFPGLFHDGPQFIQDDSMFFAPAHGLSRTPAPTCSPPIFRPDCRGRPVWRPVLDAVGSQKKRAMLKLRKWLPCVRGAFVAEFTLSFGWTRAEIESAAKGRPQGSPLRKSYGCTL